MVKGVRVMLRYIYDNTFDGLLTTIYESYYNQKPDEIVSLANRDMAMIFTDVLIETDKIKANKVEKAIKEKISRQSLNHVYKVFLSDALRCEKYIYEYIKKGFKVGANIDDMLTDDSVKWIHTQSRRVGFEAVRFEGFVRFRNIGDVLYSQIEPSYDILELLGPHFSERLMLEKWVIYDKSRKKCLFGEHGNWWMQLDVTFQLENIETDMYENMWKMYFENVSIKERENKRQQMHYMPKKYWKNIIEICND